MLCCWFLLLGLAGVLAKKYFVTLAVIGWYGDCDFTCIRLGAKCAANSTQDPSPIQNFQAQALVNLMEIFGFPCTSVNPVRDASTMVTIDTYTRACNGFADPGTMPDHPCKSGTGTGPWVQRNICFCEAHPYWNGCRVGATNIDGTCFLAFPENDPALKTKSNSFISCYYRGMIVASFPTEAHWNNFAPKIRSQLGVNGTYFVDILTYGGQWLWNLLKAPLTYNPWDPAATPGVTTPNSRRAYVTPSDTLMDVNTYTTSITDPDQFWIVCQASPTATLDGGPCVEFDGGKYGYIAPSASARTVSVGFSGRFGCEQECVRDVSCFVFTWDEGGYICTLYTLPYVYLNVTLDPDGLEIFSRDFSTNSLWPLTSP